MTVWTRAPTDPPPTSWLIEAQQIARSFDPYSFDRVPSFDTGTTEGIWDGKPLIGASWTAK